jgi:hypothetical protein
MAMFLVELAAHQDAALGPDLQPLVHLSDRAKSDPFGRVGLVVVEVVDERV